MRVEEFSETENLDSRLDRSPINGTPQLSDPLQGAERDTLGQLQNLEIDLSFLIANRENIPSDEFLSQKARLERRRLVLQEQLESESGPTAARVQAQRTPPNLGNPPPDDRVILGNIIPRSVEISRNGIRTADLCTIQLDHKDAPIDSRLLRACFVDVNLGVVDPTSFEEGIEGETRDDGSLRSLVDRSPGSGTLAAATRFVGWVDEWNVEASGDGADVVNLKCRDMTALLLDKELPSNVQIDLTLPIVSGIQALLDSFPSTRGISVFFGEPGTVGADLGPVPAAEMPSARRGRRGRRIRRARSAGQQMSLWDHITDVTVQLGFVPLFYGYDLHIIRPRTFYFSRSVPRRMVYGENISSLKFARKLGGVKVPTVEARSYDPQIGRTRWARYPSPDDSVSSGIFPDQPPPGPRRANEPGISGAAPDDRIQVYVLNGFNTSDRLSNAARSIFEQVGRQEIEGNFSTNDISSFCSREEGDLLNLQSGDAIEILTRASPAPGEERSQDNPESSVRCTEIEASSTPSSFQEIKSFSQEQRINYLESIGWSRRVAQKIAELEEATAYQTVFRVQDSIISWSAENGISVKADFINFITVREENQRLDPRPALPDPSPEITSATSDRQSDAALRARVISGERAAHTRDAEAGLITQQEYERRIERSLENERAAVRQFQES